jgi:alkylhydroperoxidase family enzyme
MFHIIISQETDLDREFSFGDTLHSGFLSAHKFVEINANSNVSQAQRSSSETLSRDWRKLIALQLVTSKSCKYCQRLSCLKIHAHTKQR